jgi:hypothetical protein
MVDEETLKREWKAKSTELLLELHHELYDIVNEFNQRDDTHFKVSDDAFIEHIAEWLKLLEGIALLFKEGLVDVSQVLTRSLFEITLHLCYLIYEDQEIENKAACYFVASNMQAYYLNKKLCDNMKKSGCNSDEGEKKNEKIIDSLKSSNILSIKSVYGYIKANNCIDENWNDTSWYGLYDTIYGKHSKKPTKCKIKKINNRQLCEMLGFYDDSENKVLMYDLIYPYLSRQAHGFSARDQIKYVDGAQFFRKTDCLQNGLWQIKVINEMFKKIVVKIPNIYEAFKFDENNDKVRELLLRCLARKKILDDLKIKLDMLYES